MKLKDIRKLGIKYCAENNCNYTYISHDNSMEFYLTENEDKHTVFLISKNGSLNVYRDTSYASDFHKELKRRKKNKKSSGKKAIANMLNCNDEPEVIENDFD